jgi:hypothetical protein
MNRVKDYMTDENPTPLFVAEAAREMPDYVKQGSFPTEEEVKELAPAMFADPFARQLPCHTKVAMLLSGIYFHGSDEWRSTPKEIREAVAARLEKAAAFHGITEDLDFYKNVFVQLEKSAALDDVPDEEAMCKYALWVADGAVTRAYYPMGDEHDIVKSARNVEEDAHYGRIPADWYVTACRELVKAAGELGVPADNLPARVRAAGEIRYPDFDYAELVVEMRKKAGVSEDSAVTYREIVDSAREEFAASGSIEGVEKWANLWLDLDAVNKVSYGRGSPDPYQAFFSGAPAAEVEKAASEIVLVHDALVPRDVFTRIDRGFVKTAFAKEAHGIITEAIRLAEAGDAPGAGQVLLDLDVEDSRDLLAKLLHT